jgi:hypothetical protein
MRWSVGSCARPGNGAKLPVLGATVEGLESGASFSSPVTPAMARKSTDDYIGKIL